MVGERIGNYRVVRKLGEGGMGAVFEAEHEQIKRRVAIKILHAQHSKDPEISHRFFNEAKAVNIVQHSGLVGAYEFGHLEDGTAYIVMEYLDGETLSERIKRLGGKLGLECLNLTRQIASALAAAHAKGVIHRDLKPANIIIVPEPETPGGERAKILDFGIAKITEQGPESDQGEHKTKTGVFMGTAKYMAPEQCKGAGKVDDKADVYSLGTMLYQMLCGRVPFDASGEGEVMAQHIYATPRQLREVDPSVPEGLAELVHRMLAKRPEERPSMAEVVLELGRWGAMTASMPAVALSGPRRVVSAFSPDLSASLAATAAAHASDPLSAPSTLGQAVGQAAQPVGRRARLALLIGGPALSVLAGMILFGGRGDKATTAQPPTAAKKVRWNVLSDPPGASVLRFSDGQVLGQTPLTREEERGTGSVEVVLRKEGFSEKRISLDRGSDMTWKEKLDALPEAPVAAPQQPPAQRQKEAPQPAARRMKKPARRILTEMKSDDDIPLVK